MTVEEAFLASPSDVDQANLALSRMLDPMTFEAVVQKTQELIDSNDTLWHIIRMFANILRESSTVTPQEATDKILCIERRFPTQKL